jgi:L-threonylcarbamoyladenylate synthase
VEEVVGGPVKVFEGSVKEGVAASSPGQQSLHYAPHAAAYRYERKGLGKVMEWCRKRTGESVAILTVGTPSGEMAVFQDELTRKATPGVLRRVVEMPGGAEEYARKLYAVLREMDRLKVGTIWVEMPPDRPAWAALRDRLMRATREG